MTKPLLPGDTAPWFGAYALDGETTFAFEQAGGTAVLMLFLGSASWGPSAAALDLIARHRALFDDVGARLFGFSLDPADAAAGRIADSLPGIRWFRDHDARIAAMYGVAEQGGGQRRYHPQWILLDPRLRVVARAPIAEGERIIAATRALATADRGDEFAPVLVVPRVFEPDFCRRLIAAYDADGGEETGFMREVNGITVGVLDHRRKRRSDYNIDDPALREQVQARLTRFLLPQIARAFQFTVTRVERYLVACYDGDNAGGYFRAHRDNTTKGTAHRRFACTINLNAEDYEGGDLIFPEFGPRRYRAPTGGAVIFSCSLLHEALPVTRGKRYCYLPFFYDDAGAKLREANSRFVTPDLAYRATAAAAAS